MKVLFKYILIAFVLLNINACKKDSGIPANNVVYEETIRDIKKDEPVLLTFSNDTAQVTWTATPLTGVTINAIGNSVTIIFSAAGTYTVLATAGNASAKYKVIVSNVDYDPYGTAFNLSASKLVNINQNEPVIFSVHNAAAGSHVAWSVSGSSYNLVVDTSNNTASVTFTSGSIGTVTASDGAHTQSRTVWINDPLNNNPNQDTVPFILGEKLKIIPSVQMVSGVKQLVLQSTTTNHYHCPTDEILSSNATDYIIDYSGVAISPQPCSPSGAASAKNIFSNVSAGNHSFTINFENKTFSGSFNVSNTGVFTFTWPDTSVVSISPLEVR